MPQPIATLELLGTTANRATFPVVVNIFAPVPDEEPCTFVCMVEVVPLHATPFKIYGDGSLQSLALGMRHAIQMLATFVEHGGILAYSEGDVFDHTVYGFKLLGEN